MKVYVAESGVYAEQFISGVYASAEAAMKDNPVTAADIEYESSKGRKPGWHKSGDGEWDNGCDFARAVSVIEFEVTP